MLLQVDILRKYVFQEIATVGKCLPGKFHSGHISYGWLPGKYFWKCFLNLRKNGCREIFTAEKCLQGKCCCGQMSLRTNVTGSKYPAGKYLPGECHCRQNSSRQMLLWVNVLLANVLQKKHFQKNAFHANDFQANVPGNNFWIIFTAGKCLPGKCHCAKMLSSQISSE
jgi:hypothetical protein